MSRLGELERRKRDFPSVHNGSETLASQECNYGNILNCYASINLTQKFTFTFVHGAQQS